MRFKHPFTCIVSGPTQSGKTVFTKKLVQNSSLMVTPEPKQVFWCYSEWQNNYEEMTKWPNVFLIQGIPDLKLLHGSSPKMVVLDDLMTDMKSDPRLVKLFTKTCHHGNVSCIHLVQNLFYSGLRTSRINAQYLVLMKSPSDQLQCLTLGRQLFPNKVKYFVESYNDACAEPHGYLLLDLHQHTPDHLRLRSHVFPGELQVVYCPKS